MIPIKLTNDTWPPKDGEFCSSIVLYYDNWNDYSYRTSSDRITKSVLRSKNCSKFCRVSIVIRFKI